MDKPSAGRSSCIHRVCVLKESKFPPVQLRFIRGGFIYHHMVDRDRLRELVEAVFSLSSQIRYVEVFNSRGVSVAGGMRPGVKSVDPPKTAAKVDVETARYALLLMRQRKYYGAMKYMYVEMERVNVLIKPLDGWVLVLTTNPPAGLDLLEKVQQTIDRFT